MTRVLIIGLGVAGLATLAQLLESKTRSITVDACEVKDEPWTFISCGELVPDPSFLSRYVPKHVKEVLEVSHKFITENTKIVNRFSRIVLRILDREYEFRFGAYLIDKSRLIRNVYERFSAYLNRRIKTPVMHLLHNCEKGTTRVCFHSPSEPTGEYDYIVAADGFESSVYMYEHRKFLIRRDYLHLNCAAFRARIRDLHRDTIYIIVDPSLAPGGYAWIFPRGDDEANCGLGVHPRYGLSLPLQVENLLKKYNVGPRRNVVGKVLPLDGTVKPYTFFHGKLMYVGDAGGFVIPTSGAGINTAIYTGLKAAEAVLEGSSFSSKVKLLADYIDKLAEFRKPIDPLLTREDALRSVMRRVSGRLIALLAYYLMLGSSKPLHRLMFMIAGKVARVREEPEPEADLQ